MKTRTDPGPRKKTIPQSEGAGVIRPRTGRTSSWWRRERTGQGVVRPEEKERTPAVGEHCSLEGQGGRQGREETGQQECNCGKNLGTGRSMRLRRGIVGQPRPPRGGTEWEAEFGQAWGLQGEEKTEYWGQSRPRMAHQGY